ncbi:Lrp/AsnC family transcriptional regulator [Thalassobaculum fulvum]|nr:Lrp/AsnC family transcriptional regulator [Thalassobaculum fulvum]
MSARAMADLDAFDRKLLALVQENARLTAEQLGERVGLSASACHRRLRRLREAGVIEAEIAVVAPETVGRSLTMIVEVSLEREHPHIIDAFKRSMRATPEVMQCYYVTGDADFIIILTARDMKSYERFTQRFFFDNPQVRKFRTFVVMDRTKVGLGVPMDDRDD